MATKSFIKSLTASGDSHFMEVVRHTIWAMFLLGITTVVQFAFDFLLTHRFGAHGAGVFYLCFSVLLALSLIGRLGLEQAVIRFIPPLLKRPGEVAGVQRSAVLLSLFISIPLAIMLFAFAPWLASDVFHSEELMPYLRIFAVILPIFSLNYIYSGVLRALKESQASLLMARFGYYAIGIIGILTLGSSFGIDGVVLGFSAGILLSTLAGLWFIRRRLPSYETLIPFNKKLLLITSLPLLFVIFATQMNGQASVLILGAASTSAAVGIYTIALKVSMLMNLILTAVNTVAATKISELYYAGKHTELNILVSKISALGALCGIPLFVVLAVFSSFWMGLFGDHFVSGAMALVLLAAGQLVNVAVGSTNFILAMTGRERMLAIAIGMSLVLNVVLGLILIPIYGVEGASIATAAANVLSNILTTFMVKYYLGVWPLPFKYMSLWLHKLRKQEERQS